MFIEQAINVILPLTVCINWKCLILQVKHSLEIWFTELCIHKEKTQTSLCVGSGISFHLVQISSALLTLTLES